MSLSLSSAPAAEPLSLDEVKAHLRIDSDASDEDAYLTTLIKAAREYVEAYTGRALITQTWIEKMDAFPASDQWALPKPPLSSVTSIAYVDGNGDSQTWSSSNYAVNAPSGPRAEAGTISLAYGVTYPTTRSIRDAVTVTFVAGYGAAGSSVPTAILQAMLLVIGEMYERREVSVVGTVTAANKFAIQQLLASYVAGGW